MPDSGIVALWALDDPYTTVNHSQQEEIGLHTLTSDMNVVEGDYNCGLFETGLEFHPLKDAHFIDDSLPKPFIPGTSLGPVSPALSFRSSSSDSSPWDKYSGGSPDLFSPLTSPELTALVTPQKGKYTEQSYNDANNHDIVYYNPLDGFKQEGLLERIRLDSLRPIGKGAFGVVWKGSDEEGEEYAVKVVMRTPENEPALIQEIHALNTAYGSPWVANLYHFDFSETEVLFITVRHDIRVGFLFC
jgi:hypothetical protein